MQRAVFPCLLLSGCIIITGPGDDDDPGAGGTESVSSDPFVCPAWEGATQADVEALVDSAIKELQAEGQSMTTDALGDPARFSALVDRVYTLAGCPFPDGVVQQELHAGEAPNYFCGPGHGQASLKYPPVSDCLNRACQDHDGCYAMCSQEVGLTCSWSGATQPCDDDFFAASAKCPTAGFIDFVVKVTPHLLESNPLPCGNVECPSGGSLGQGVCSVDRLGADCVECLAFFDPEGACLARTECPQDSKPDLCYAANCPNVFACFGENPSSELWKTTCASSSYSGVPEDYTWQVEVISGEMPWSKADGSAWDVGAGLGYEPPDPFAYVELLAGGSMVKTPSPEDTAFPSWNFVAFSGLQSATIESGIVLDVWDRDLVVDDFIGSCTVAPTAANFCDGLLEAECSPGDLTVRLRLQPEL